MRGTHAFNFPDFALEVLVFCLILGIFGAGSDPEGMKRTGRCGMRRGEMTGHGQPTGGRGKYP